MENMKAPRTRAEFERNFHLLRRQLEDGNLHFAQELSRTLDGLLRVRFLPNGRIDFLSVDEMARLQANMMNQFNEESLQKQLKEYQGPTDASTGAEDAGSPILDPEKKAE